MQNLKITIPGKYWDSYVYSGRLYLFTESGEILTIDWDRLIDEMRIEKNLWFALQCAYKRGDYFYRYGISEMLYDPEIRQILSSKFARLAMKELQVSKRRLNSLSFGIQENKLVFPHSDIQIYYNKLYASGEDGIYSASANKRTKYPISTRPVKLWDARTFSLSMSYRNIAIASGDDGLYEMSTDDYSSWGLKSDTNLRQVSHQYCTSCEWVFQSIYCSSLLSPGYLAAFTKENIIQGNQKYTKRYFDQLYSEPEIFATSKNGKNGNQYSWGNRDKLCKLLGNEIQVIRYNPWEDKSSGQLSDIGIIKFKHQERNLIEATTALFGTILEFDDSLLIIKSDGGDILLSGEPVNWRIFPRSKYYKNQLHVVHEDHLEIYSFNHDYLIDQDEKISGSKFYLQ